MLESLTFFCIFRFDKAGDKEVKKIRRVESLPL